MVRHDMVTGLPVEPDPRGLGTDPYLNDRGELLAGLERSDRAPAPTDPYAVSHWKVTRCPYKPHGAPRACGAFLETRGLVTTCPVSLSHYTRVLASPEQEEGRAAKGIPKHSRRA